MPNYLAKYTVWASIYDGGCFMPDPEPHKPEYGFKAKDNEEAKRKALEYIPEVGREWFGVKKVTLDQLLKITEVKL